MVLPAFGIAAQRVAQLQQQQQCWYSTPGVFMNKQPENSKPKVHEASIYLNEIRRLFQARTHGSSISNTECTWLAPTRHHAAHSRSFAAVSTALSHSGCGHSHHHDEPCTDETTAKIKLSPDLQQLQQLVDDLSSTLKPAHAAAAFRRAAILADSAPATAAPVLDLLAPIWPGLVATATSKDLADVLLSWTKLQASQPDLWATTLAAVPAHVPVANGQDLANIAYALAAMTGAHGGVPGVDRPAVEELLRKVTAEVVQLVQGKGAGDGCAGGRSVSVGNLATVRWAHEVFEELGG